MGTFNDFVYYSEADMFAMRQAARVEAMKEILEDE